MMGGGDDDWAMCHALGVLGCGVIICGGGVFG